MAGTEKSLLIAGNSSGEYNMGVSKEHYTIKPQYREIEEDESEIVGYEVM